MNRFIFSLLFLLITTSAPAASFKGITPGLTTKEGADSILGAPTRAILSGSYYEYDAAAHDARRLSVVVNDKTQVVKQINIYPREARYKDTLLDWLGLEGPAAVKRDDEGNLIEEYPQNGIALHFSGPEETQPVEFIRFYESQSVPGGWSGNGSNPQRDGEGFAFLGVRVMEHDGLGVKVFAVIRDSPAEGAGIRRGDVIVDAGGVSFQRERVSPYQFVEAVKGFPVGEPVNLVVERSGSRYDVEVVLRWQNQKDFEQKQAAAAKEAEKSFQLGQKAFQKNDYAKAIRYFNEACAACPIEAGYWIALGDVYSRMGDFPEAVAAYESAVVLSPDFESLYALGRAYAEDEQAEAAIPLLKRAIRLCEEDRCGSRPYELLARCFYDQGKHEDSLGLALKAYRMSRKRSAPAAYYLAASFDKLGHARDAMYYYNCFLRLKPGDEKREVLARTRLKALKNDPAYKAKKEKSRQSWLGMMNAVTESIKAADQFDSSGPATSGRAPAQSGTDWSSGAFESNTGDWDQKYDSLFTLPPGTAP